MHTWKVTPHRQLFLFMNLVFLQVYPCYAFWFVTFSVIEFLWLFVSICDSFLISSTLLFCDLFIDFLLFSCVWLFFLWLFCDFFFLLLCCVSFLMWCFLSVTFFPVIFVTVTWSGCFNLCSSEVSCLNFLCKFGTGFQAANCWCNPWFQLRQVALHALVGDDGGTQDACQRFACVYICPNCWFDSFWSLPMPSSQQIMFDHLADSSKPGRFPATLCVLLLQVPISKGLGENPERRRQEPLNTS